MQGRQGAKSLWVHDDGACGWCWASTYLVAAVSGFKRHSDPGCLPYQLIVAELATVRAHRGEIDFGLFSWTPNWY